MRASVKIILLLLAASLFLPVAARAADVEKSPFHAGRAEGGELKFIDTLPVLLVGGTPEEIGRQKAALTGEAVKAIADYPRKLLRTLRCEQRWPNGRRRRRAALPAGPGRPSRGDAGVRQGPGRRCRRRRGANTIMDTYRGWLGCSSLLVSAEKSATKAPLMGRNLDFYTLGILDKYGLVTVYRPRGKHAFAAVGMPGMLGCLSGMNDAGLALAVHEVYLAADGSKWLNLKGMPYTLCFRRILEECESVEEAEKVLPLHAALDDAQPGRLRPPRRRRAGDDAQERGAAPRQGRHLRLHQSFPQPGTGRLDLVPSLRRAGRGRHDENDPSSTTSLGSSMPSTRAV